jgi:two-component system response regulator RegX3
MASVGSQADRPEREAAPDCLPSTRAVVVVSRRRSVSEGLRRELHEQGIEATTADSAGSATSQLGEAPLLAVIVDATPGLDDRELAEAVRLSAGAPVLVLPASGVVHPEVLPDPVDPPLDPWAPGSVVRSQLAAAATVALALSEAVLNAGPIGLDVLRHEVRVDGKPVWFTPKEFELLELLMRVRGHVLSAALLQARVWGTEGGASLHNLYVHIRRIRQKIERDPRRPRHLLTVRGSGYRLQG